MTKHVVRIELHRHHRIYLPGQEHSFEEWPDETRDAEIEALVVSGHLEAPAPPAPIVARTPHKDVASAPNDLTDNTKED